GSPRRSGEGRVARRVVRGDGPRQLRAGAGRQEPGARRRGRSMSDTQSLLQRAEIAAAQGQASESLKLTEEAVAAAGTPRVKFDALLQRARAELAADQPARALDTYWEARHLTKRHRLGRAGEADLGLGMMLLD